MRGRNGASVRGRLPGSPWVYVAVAAAAMGAAGTYQFGWSSLRPALAGRVGAGETALGTVFTVYVVAQTVSQFPAGRVRDRRGPRLPAAVGAVLLAAGYLGTAAAAEPWQALAAYALGGVGAGTVYTVAVNTPVKWFTDRRGLATGVVTMAYGGVSVLFVPYVRAGLATDFAGTLGVVAALAGGAGLLAAVVLRDPGRSGERQPAGDDPVEPDPAERDPAGRSPADHDADDDDEATEETDRESRRHEDGSEEAGTDDGGAYTWREAVRTWQFWVLYAMLVVVNGVGLMLIGTAVGFAEQFGFAAAVATGAASAVALADSAGIVAVGGLSDRLGREVTVAATVVCSGVAVAGAVLAGRAGAATAFVGLVGAAAFFRSPVFSVVPALVGEYYGRARSSENYAALYTARVWGGVGGGVVASALVATVGWSTAFLLGAAALVGAGLLAGLLRPVEGSPAS